MFISWIQVAKTLPDEQDMAMYFFDLDGLVDRLASRALSARECVSYLLGFFVYRIAGEAATTILPILAGIPANRTDPSDAPFTAVVTLLITGAIGLLIMRWVLLRFFEANGGDFDDQFLPNLFAVVWVVNNRMMLWYIPSILLIYYLLSPTNALSGGGTMAVSAFALVLVFAIMIAIFSSTRRCLREIRAKKVARLGAI